MANVDSKLHDSGSPRDRVSEKPKIGLRGAAGGIYVGPILSTASGAKESSITHATGANPGGAEDSTGYRKSDTYFQDGTEGMGEAPTAQTRPTGRTSFTGVVTGLPSGTSVPGYPAQRARQRAVALGGGAFLDKRSTGAGEFGGALGSDRGGSRVLGESVTAALRVPRPLVGTSANPSAGTVAVIDGTAKLTVDLNASDVTAYAGAEVILYERGTDTDEDGAFVGKSALFDSATEGDLTFDGSATLAAGVYAVYTRFVDNDGKPGPLSARGTATVS